MEEGRAFFSLYEYRPQMTVVETTAKGTDSNAAAAGTGKGRAVGQDIIVKLLATYGFLTQPLIKRCLKMRGHRRIDPARTLNKMQAKGKVLKHTIRLEGSDRQDLDIYTLSPEMRKRLKEQGYELIHYKYDMSNIPYVLERLSTAQWHIGCLESAHVKEAAYHWRVATEDNRTAIIPSLTEYITFRNSRLYIIGIPAPKGEYKEDLMKFLMNVYLMEEYLKENRTRFRSRVYVIICEDDRQSEDICRYATKIRELAGLYLLYATDQSTREGKEPLTKLLELKVKKTDDGEKIERRIISIR